MPSSNKFSIHLVIINKFLIKKFPFSFNSDVFRDLLVQDNLFNYKRLWKHCVWNNQYVNSYVWRFKVHLSCYYGNANKSPHLVRTCSNTWHFGTLGEIIEMQKSNWVHEAKTKRLGIRIHGIKLKLFSKQLKFSSYCCRWHEQTLICRSFFYT